MDTHYKKITEYSDLVSWQKSYNLALTIYAETKHFPKEELWLLTSQMRRSAISISSNIAEGFGRRTYRDRLHFYYIAQGSLTELKTQIRLAGDLKYIARDNYKILTEEINTCHKLLQGLMNKTKEFISHTS